MIFDESIAFKRPKDLLMDSNDEELLVFEDEVAREEEESNQEDKDPNEPIQPVVILETRKRPNWLKSILLDARGHAVAQVTFMESKNPKQYFGYASYMKKLIEAYPSTFEESINYQEWMDAMNEE